MGRLLKKKDPGQKKKKMQENRGRLPAGGSEMSAVAAEAGAGAVSKSGQSRGVSVKKSSLGGAALKIKYVDQALQFLREVKVELKKVVWPSRKQTVASTVVVIVLVLIVSLFLGVVDFGLSSLIKVVLS